MSVPTFREAGEPYLSSRHNRNRQYHAFEAMRRYIEAEVWQVELVAERLRQLDAGEIDYASVEHVAAARAKTYSNGPDR